MLHAFDTTKIQKSVTKLQRSVKGVQKVFKKVSVDHTVFVKDVFDFHKDIVKVMFQNKK